MKVENTATLESSLVERFKNLLFDYKMILKENEKITYEWWKELNTSFKDLNRNYQDYISRFYSLKNDELMKTTEFLIVNALAIAELIREENDDVVTVLRYKWNGREKTLLARVDLKV